mmetsp:Transcript_18098/g.41704  ORF Transcript_18098/g.41704 Transcript_18098/m.41704 type:complete len:208 (+) Transcript_18098:1561-2184(+)
MDAESIILSPASIQFAIADTHCSWGISMISLCFSGSNTFSGALFTNKMADMQGASILSMIFNSSSDSVSIASWLSFLSSPDPAGLHEPESQLGISFCLFSFEVSIASVSVSPLTVNFRELKTAQSKGFVTISPLGSKLFSKSNSIFAPFDEHIESKRPQSSDTVCSASVPELFSRFCAPISSDFSPFLRSSTSSTGVLSLLFFCCTS